MVLKNQNGYNMEKAFLDIIHYGRSIEHFDESDQVAMINEIINAHVASHNGEVREDCDFCNAFINTKADLKTYPLESYKFIILDVSEDGK